ncbi:MAG: glycosyltransferase family 2 protein [Variovorax sp.]|nr:glycosyltransferase family 2 protein [Variovorax sp.]
MRRERLALYGIVLVLLAIFAYSLGVLIAVPRRLFFDTPQALLFNELLIWYSGFPFLVGWGFILLDLFILYPAKRRNDFIKHDNINTQTLTVVLTAYNDEASIGPAVRDFLDHPAVKRVIVISNNSKDRTMDAAEEAGALVFNESRQGYGACVYRALSEGCRFEDSEIVVLCEGDMTFRAYDIDKLMAYIPHADIVTGTRTVEQLRAKDTQLSTFMFYGNVFVGKLLEIKHLGNATFSDVGTTYKACRSAALRELLPKLNPEINLEFNPYFLDVALQSGLRILEAPISFHKRIGESKGGNIDNLVALKLGLKMIRGIVWRWS